MSQDLLRFGREWLRSPLKVGAVVPSGPVLASLITDGIDPRTGPVIELGPGTGVFTRALLSRGFTQDDLALVEASESFAGALREQHPSLKIFVMDAARLRHVHPFGRAGAAAVVSGLPFASIPAEKTLQILHGVQTNLRPGGVIRLFTYAPTCPISGEIRARLGLSAMRLASTVRNLPPASVYELRRMR